MSVTLARAVRRKRATSMPTTTHRRRTGIASTSTTRRDETIAALIADLPARKAARDARRQATTAAMSADLTEARRKREAVSSTLARLDAKRKKDHPVDPAPATDDRPVRLVIG